MPSSSSVPLKRVSTSSRIHIEEKVWKTCEDAMDAGPFNSRMRENIQLACSLYRTVGLQYEPSNIMPVGSLKKAIQRWRDDTDRLLKLLNPSSVKQQPREESDLAVHITAVLENSKSTKLPAEFLASVLQFASASGTKTLAKLDELTVGLEHDFWSIWVALIGKCLEENGLKITAASQDKNKTDIPSPFVQMIMSLQEILPPVCQRRKGIESLVKGINSARRRWKPQSQAGLYYVLAGQGLQARRGKNRISAIDDSAELDLELQRHVEELQREVKTLKARKNLRNDESQD